MQPFIEYYHDNPKIQLSSFRLVSEVAKCKPRDDKSYNNVKNDDPSLLLKWDSNKKVSLV